MGSGRWVGGLAWAGQGPLGTWRRKYPASRGMESVTESFSEEGMLLLTKKGNRLPDDFYGRVLNSLVPVFYPRPPQKSGCTGRPLGFSSLKMLLLPVLLVRTGRLCFFQLLTAKYKKRSEGGREAGRGRTAGKSSYQGRWGASFLKPLELTHPHSPRTVKVPS